jgi:capsule polysaccharide export protein KpsE/RkpR
MDRLRNTAVHELERSPEYSPNAAANQTEHPQRDRSALLNSVILLWRHRQTLKRITLAGALATLVIAFLIPNTYESSTRLMAPDIRGGGSEMAMMAGLLAKASGGVAGLASNLLGGNNTGALFVGVLRSRSIADNLVNKFDLKKAYWVRKDADARDKLADRTDVSEDRKSGIITIAVVDRNPSRAADLARAYVDELNRLLALVNTSSAHRERMFIEERLVLVKKELDTAAKQLSDFSVKNTAIDPKEQGKAMLGAAVALQGELIADETQLRGLEAIYTDNNVRVKSLKARIAELRHQIEEFRGTDPGQPSGSEDTDNSSYPSFRKLPALGVTYADLFREVKIREAVFETLTQQYELARIEEAKEIPA